MPTLSYIRLGAPVIRGDVPAAIIGVWASAEAPDHAAMAGMVITAGIWSSTEAPDIAAFSAPVPVTGTWASTEAADIAAMAGPSLTDQVRTALFGGGEAGGMWDMTDIAALSQDAAGTVPVAAYGDPIGRVADLSGNGNHLIQGAALDRPAWTADGAHPNGVNNYLTLASLDLSACDKVVVAMGYNKIDDVDRIQIEFDYSTFAPGTFQLVSGSNYGLHHWGLAHGDAANGADQAASATAVVPHGYGAHISRHSIPDDLSEMWWQGVKHSSGVGDKGGGSFGVYPLFVFARAGSVFFSNTPARRAIILGIPVGQPQMSDAGIELIRQWLEEGV